MNTIDVILHPTDFSADSEQAFQLACSIARDQFAELVVVHVLAPPNGCGCDSEEDLLHEDRPEVQNCRQQFGRLNAMASDIPLSFRIATGYAVTSILNVAKEEHANLIVIASHRHSQIHLQLHGSIAEGVLRQSDCPVLCLRQPSPHHALRLSSGAEQTYASGYSR